jgi:hypothetical protein
MNHISKSDPIRTLPHFSAIITLFHILLSPSRHALFTAPTQGSLSTLNTTVPLTTRSRPAPLFHCLVSVSTPLPFRSAPPVSLSSFIT